jgi:hypothetical protein
MDLDKKQIDALPSDACDDPKPSIYVYNCIEYIDVNLLAASFSNHMIRLLDGYYGICCKKFNCYTSCKYNYRKVPKK